MKTTLSVKDRKRLQRLKREILEMEAKAYKHDLDEDWAVAGEKLNSRYEQALKEVEKLNKK